MPKFYLKDENEDFEESDDDLEEDSDTDFD